MNTNHYETTIDGLANLDFVPSDMTTEEIDDRKMAATVDYYAARHWDAYRIDAAGVITFARFSEDGCKLLKTNSAGVISAEASFSFTESGIAMFIAAAAV